MAVINWEFPERDIATIDAIRETIKTSSFGTEEERKAFRFGVQKNLLDAWRRVGKCSFPGCSATSIRRSHTLSRALMIEPLAEDGHVVALEVDMRLHAYQVKRIGTRVASTFPGFCEEHENEFEFERGDGITSGRQLQKQLFRTVCHQMHFLKCEQEIAREAMQELERRVSLVIDRELPQASLEGDKGVIRAYLLEDAVGNRKHMSKQRAVNLDYDMENWFMPHARNFGRFPTEFGFFDELIKFPGGTNVALTSPMLLPGTPRDEGGTPDFSYQYYVNIFPNGNHALVHLTAPIDKRAQLEQLAVSIQDSGGNSIVSQWLLATEHWYMRPTCWDSLDDKEQARILAR